MHYSDTDSSFLSLAVNFTSLTMLLIWEWRATEVWSLPRFQQRMLDPQRKVSGLNFNHGGYQSTNFTIYAKILFWERWKQAASKESMAKSFPLGKAVNSIFEQLRPNGKWLTLCFFYTHLCTIDFVSAVWCTEY